MPRNELLSRDDSKQEVACERPHLFGRPTSADVAVVSPPGNVRSERHASSAAYTSSSSPFIQSDGRDRLEHSRLAFLVYVHPIWIYCPMTWL